ncbi:MAG TPA: Ig-like domain-containing protein, partial [Ilumatobacteraceae bacterium]
ATRWLVDQRKGNVVLVDGLAGHVLARIQTESKDGDEVAVQGIGGAFLVGKSKGSVRTISTAKLQLGTAKTVGLLVEPNVKFGVGASGLTVVKASRDKSEASVVDVADVTRTITVPKAESAYVASDGSMWLLSANAATHVNIDQSSTTEPLRSRPIQTATIGSHAVSYDPTNHVLRWLDGADVSLDSSLANPSEAVLQQSSDDAPCVWLASGATMACVGRTGVDHTTTIVGMRATTNDKLAVAGSAAVLISADNHVKRIDLEGGVLADDGDNTPTLPSASPGFTITAAGDLIWLDDASGEDAWIVYRFGINHIRKDDKSSVQLDAQGQVQDNGSGDSGTPTGGGNAQGGDISKPRDNNGREDPPVAIDDSVTARAGTTITIPVLGNDYDPDGDAIAVIEGDTASATHGTTDVLDGTSIAYRPQIGYSGSDTFRYTITDESGATASAAVHVELFSADSANRPPIARADSASTHVGKPVVIDVLANDIDPERDALSVSTFQGVEAGIVTEVISPTGLPALRYTPPENGVGTYNFTYQAVDPQGGTSQKTRVTIDVSASSAPNQPPTANSDAMQLSVGASGDVDVRTNDTDPDGDELTIESATQPTGLRVTVVAQQLHVEMLPGAERYSVIKYRISDGFPGNFASGKVLVVRLADTAPNRQPVANPDSDRVVVGNSVKIPVTLNDVDPDHDDITLLSAENPSDGSGTVTREGNSVRFVPNLPDITQPTAVTFKYTIGDGHGNTAVGNVTVTVLVEALPRAPFARDDFADTVVGKTVNIDVLANDTDPSGGRPSLIANPVCLTGGVATRTPDDRVAFVPPDTPGTYRCKYTVSNNQGLSAEASIIVTVTPATQGNRPPVMDADRATQPVDLGKTLVLTADFLANDDDGDHLMFSSVSVANPAHGSTDFTQKTDTIVYTAPTVGSADRVPVNDTLDVVISDGQGGNVQGRVSIRVNDTSSSATTPPQPPGTHPIFHAIVVGPTVPFDIVKELADQNTGPAITLTKVEYVSGPGTADLVQGNAVVTGTSPGTIVAKYTVTSSAGSSVDTMTITVTPNPDVNPPVAIDDAMSIASGGTNSISLVANDLGISDPGDVPQTALLTRPPNSFGAVQLLNNTLTFAAAPGAQGSARIQYQLVDGSGLSSTANVVLSVDRCSESPPSATNASVFTPYATPISIDLTDYVISGHIRPDSVSGAGLTGVTGVYKPPAGMNGDEVVTYVVENGCKQTVEAQLTIDVNRAPIGGSVTRNVSRETTLTLPVEALASDDETLTIVDLAGEPTWVVLDPGGPSGNSGLDVPAILATPPANVATGKYSFDATVQDPGGLTATARVHLVISNIAPTAIPDDYKTDQALFTFDPTLNDFDTEPGDLNIQTISWDPPSDSPITHAGNSVTVALAHGESTLNYTIVDSGGLTASSTITITYNRKPTIDPDNVTAEHGSTAQIPLAIGEPDGDAVTVKCVAPDGVDAQVLNDPNPDGNPVDPLHPRFELDVVLPDAHPSTMDVPCTVMDSFGASATATIHITIE